MFHETHQKTHKNYINKNGPQNVTLFCVILWNIFVEYFVEYFVEHFVEYFVEHFV